MLISKGEENVYEKNDFLQQSHCAFNARSYFEIGYADISTLGRSVFELNKMKMAIEMLDKNFLETCFHPACSDGLCRAMHKQIIKDKIIKELASASTLYC